MDHKNTDDHYSRSKEGKCPVPQGGHKRASGYNSTDMLEQTMSVKKGFAHRLAVLRTAKGISARELSLSMGMTANYINSIENGNNLPSMSMFFEICAALDVTPKEFFDYSEMKTKQKAEIVKHIENLSGDALECVLKLIKMMER